MTRINDLDPQILYRILCIASGETAKNIDEWKDSLFLLQVCTKWYSLLKSYVFSQGFISIYLAKRETNSESSTRSCVYYTNSNLVCRSNLGVITGRNEYNCDCVSTLEVNVSFLDISQYAHILKKLLTLGAGYWLNLSSLSFCIYFDLNNPSRPREMMNLEESSATISNYIHVFQNRLPNITHLKVGLNKDVSLKTALSILINHYAPRLQLLYIDYPTRSLLPVFSAELTSLSLDLDEYAYRHSSFYAKSLQYLELNNISSNGFLWQLFYGFTTPGSIEFTNLKHLACCIKIKQMTKRFFQKSSQNRLGRTDHTCSNFLNSKI